MNQKTFLIRSFAFLLSLLSVFICSCKKDIIEEHIQTSVNQSLSVEELKEKYSNNTEGVVSRGSDKTPLNVKPNWSTLTKISKTVNFDTLVAEVDTSTFYANSEENAYIAFFKDSLGGINSSLLCWKKKSGTTLNLNYSILSPESNFTGLIMLINQKNVIYSFGLFNEGVLRNFKNTNLAIRDTDFIDLDNTIISRGDPDCPSVNKRKSFWEWFWNGLVTKLQQLRDGLISIYEWFAWLATSGFSSSGNGFMDVNSSDSSNGADLYWLGIKINNYKNGGSDGVGGWTQQTQFFVTEYENCKKINDHVSNASNITLYNPLLCTLNSYLNLSLEEYAHLCPNTTLTKTLYDYLEKNNFSQESKELVKYYLLINSTLPINTFLDINIFDFKDLMDKLSIGAVEKAWLALNSEALISLSEYSKNKTADETTALLNFYFQCDKDGNINGLTSLTLLEEAIKNKLNLDAFWVPAYINAVMLEAASLRLENPTWTTRKIAWEAIKTVSEEGFHFALDAAGMVPVIGEVADLTHGVIYSIQGDWVNASFSYAAAIPVIGWGSTTAKYAHKTVTFASGRSGKLKFFKNISTNLIEFGRREQLRGVLGIKSIYVQAHHIIPWGKGVHPAVQKAAGSSKAFHLNEALNGIPLSDAVHSGSHPHYDGLIDYYLSQIPSNASPDDAYDAILEIIKKVRNAVNSNPNTHINNLIF